MASEKWADLLTQEKKGEWTIFYGRSCGWCHKAMDLLCAHEAGSGYIRLKPVNRDPPNEHYEYLRGRDIKTVPFITYWSPLTGLTIEVGGYQDLAEFLGL